MISWLLGLLGLGNREAISPAQFTSEFLKAYQKASPGANLVEKAELELQFTSAGGAESSVFLHNAYQTYLNDPGMKKEVMRQYIASHLSIASMSEKIDPTCIVPIIKDRQWQMDVAAELKARGAEAPADNIVEDYNEQLVIVYAEDNPQSVRFLTPDHLEETGLARSDLRALAVANLKRIIPKIELHKGPELIMVTAGGYYEACLLLLDGIWNYETMTVHGDIVVAIPARDLLLVTGSKTPNGIAKLRELAQEQLKTASYRLTDSLFVYRDGRFTGYVE